MQKRLKQTKVYHTFFYFVSKRTTHKPLKGELQKPISPVGMLSVQIASMHFILCDNWKALLFIKVYRFSPIFLTVMMLLSLKLLF